MGALSLVVGPGFEGDIDTLTQRSDTWVRASPSYERVAHQYFLKHRGEDSHLSVFYCEDVPSPEQVVATPESVFLQMIWRAAGAHDSVFGSNSWLQLEVFGVHATPAIRAELLELGATGITETERGFRCARQGAA